MTILEALKCLGVKLAFKNRWLVYDISLGSFKIYESKPNINLLRITKDEHEAVKVLLEGK